jgi:hypothetical protein
MGLHDPFGYSKHKLWPKEGLGVKLPIWLPTTKSQESPWFFVFMCCATYRWKDLDEGYNFSLDLISIRGLQKNYGPSKSWNSPFQKNLDSQLGSPGTKWHLGAGPVVRHKECYRGEGGGFLQVRVVMSFESLCLLVAHLCTKSAPTMH